MKQLKEGLPIAAPNSGLPVWMGMIEPQILQELKTGVLMGNTYIWVSDKPDDKNKSFDAYSSEMNQKPEH
jgi:hypothetical protein